MIKNLSLNRRCAVIVALAGVVWAALAAIVLAMPFINIIGFLAFQLFAVALPGAALVKLFGLRLSPLGAFTVSYALGLGVNIALYFCFAPFFFTSPIKYCAPVIALAALAALYIKRKTPFSVEKDDGELKTALIAAFIVLLVTFASIPSETLNPYLSGARYYFHDNMHAVSMTASAARGFPLEYLQMTGVTDFYHPFLYAYAAVLELTLNMTAFEVMTKLTLVTIVPFLCCTTVLLAKKLTKSKAALWISTFFSILLPVGSAMYYYVYCDLLGFQLGVVNGLLAVYFFLRSCESAPKKLDVNFALTVVFSVFSLGGKGPVAVSFVFGICFVLLIRIIRDKNYFGFVKGAVLGIIFVVFYLLLYRASGDGSMSLSIGYSAIRTSFGEKVFNSLPAPFGMIVACIVYSLSAFPAIPLSLAASIILLRLKKLNNDALWFNIGASVFGLVMIVLFKQVGSSEVYFVISLFQLSIILLAGFGEIVFDSIKKRNKGLSLVLLAIVLVFTLWRAYGYSWYYFTSHIGNAITYNRFSDNKITTQAQYDELEAEGRRRSTVTPEEYEGYLWLRENTEKFAVIADTRYSTNSKFAYGTAFSERGFYLEGAGFATAENTNVRKYAEFVRRDAVLQFFYADEDEGFIPLIKQEGIDYIIISQYMNPGFTLTDQYAQKVFENSGVTIYEVK